ncbi:SNAP receptor [Aureococcus anophagefferens]|nr:SNAP receptor [Aureococcus anophagefferens]
MTILYALVARGNTVLAEYTFTSGNFPTITRVLLGKIPEQDGKMSYVYDQYVFHYVVENKMTSFKRRVPFAFLDDVKNRFFATYGDKGQAAIAFAYNEDFGRTIQKQLEFYNGPQADQFATVHKKLDDVKNVMVQNIEMKSSKKLRQAMFWKKVKIYMLIACVVLVLLYIFLAVLCGPTFEKCGNKDKK